MEDIIYDISDELHRPGSVDIDDLYQRVKNIVLRLSTIPSAHLDRYIDNIIKFYEYYSDVYIHGIYDLFELHHLVPERYKQRIGAVIIQNLDNDNISWIYNNLCA